MRTDGDRRPDLATQRAGHAVLAHLSSRYAARLRTGQGLVTTVDDLVSWAVGYLGEVRVGEVLAGLDGRWGVLHAVPLGVRSKDIDHLLIGPAGIFAINTKHHPGARVTVKGRDALYVNGIWKPYLKDARRDATAVGDLLTPAGPIDVQAVICLVEARLTATTTGEAVHVVDIDDLVPWLTSLRETLDGDSVDRAYAHAQRAGTWPGCSVPAAPDGADSLARDLAARPAAVTHAQPAKPPSADRTPPVPMQRTRGFGRLAPARLMSAPSERNSAAVQPRDDTHTEITGLICSRACSRSRPCSRSCSPGLTGVTVVLRPLMDSLTCHFVTNNLPQPTGTDPTLPVHAVGTACSVQGERVRSAVDGSQIECLPLPAAGNGLQWPTPSAGSDGIEGEPLCLSQAQPPPLRRRRCLPVPG